MGTEFWWFYDIAAVAIAVGIIYKCTRKGFMSSVAGLVGTVVSFALALFLSGAMSDYFYDNLVYKGIDEKISFSGENPKSTEKIAFLSLRAVDMSKATVAGKTLNELNLEPDSAGKVTLDLTEVDLYDTGIRSADLSFFGVDVKKADFRNINLNKVNLKAKELEEFDIGTLILAKTVSYEMAANAKNAHAGLTKMMEDVVPGYSKVTEGSADLVSKMLAAVIESENTGLKAVINEKLVRPTLIVPIRAVIFAILFTVFGIICGVIVKSLGLVSGIPVVGFANTLFGAVLGVAEAVVVLFIVCIGIGLIISITGDNIIFLNTLTIGNTKIFGYIYRLGFLDFKI